MEAALATLALLRPAMNREAALLGGALARTALLRAALERAALSWRGAVGAYKCGADGGGACNAGTIEGSAE